MPSARAASSALWRSREAIALNSTHSPFCMAGNTFFMPIPAVLSTPQRTLFGISESLPEFAARPDGVAFLQKSAEPLAEVGAVADFFIPSYGTCQVAIEALLGKRAQQFLHRAHGFRTVPEQQRCKFAHTRHQLTFGH